MRINGKSGPASAPIACSRCRTKRNIAFNIVSALQDAIQRAPRPYGCVRTIGTYYPDLMTSAKGEILHYLGED